MCSGCVLVTLGLCWPNGKTAIFTVFCQDFFVLILFRKISFGSIWPQFHDSEHPYFHSPSKSSHSPSVLQIMGCTAYCQIGIYKADLAMVRMWRLVGWLQRNSQITCCLWRRPHALYSIGPNPDLALVESIIRGLYRLLTWVFCIKYVRTVLTKLTPMTIINYYNHKLNIANQTECFLFSFYLFGIFPF